MDVGFSEGKTVCLASSCRLVVPCRSHNQDFFFRAFFIILITEILDNTFIKLAVLVSSRPLSSNSESVLKFEIFVMGGRTIILCLNERCVEDDPVLYLPNAMNFVNQLFFP